MRPAIHAVVLLLSWRVAAANRTLHDQERSVAQFLPLSSQSQWMRPGWSPFRVGLKLDSRQGGQCSVECGGGLCCDVGLICCDGGGCCPTGFYCTAVGCCPEGKTCGDSLTPCPSDPSQLLCAGGNCCPKDMACASHDGVRGCDPPRGSESTSTGSASDTSASSSSTSTSASSSTSSPPPTVTSSDPTSTFDPSGTLTFTPTPGLPASPPGVSQTVVTSDDTRIIYTPADAWSDVQEQACKGNQVKRSTTLGSELSFSFNGSAVALLTTPWPNSGLYEVVVTDANVQPVQAALVNGFSSTQQCATGFATRGLGKGIYTITVQLKAASQNQGAALDVNAIMYWDENIEPISGGTGTGGASTSRAPRKAILLSCYVVIAFYKMF